MKNVTEEQLLKALGELETDALESADVEEPVAKGGKKMAAKSDDSDSDDESSDEESSEEPAKKSHTEAEPGMPDDTEEANGGLAHLADPNEDEEHFDVDADGHSDPTGASMKSLVAENDALRKGFEVSGFLEGLVDTNVQSVDALRKSLIELQTEQRAFNAKLQKAMVALGTAVLELKKSHVEESEAPVAPGPRSVMKSTAAERFVGDSQQAQPQYTREQTLEALTQLAEAGKIPAITVSAYETSSFIEPTLVGTVTAKLSQMYR